MVTDLHDRPDGLGATLDGRWRRRLDSFVVRVCGMSWYDGKPDSHAPYQDSSDADRSVTASTVKSLEHVIERVLNLVPISRPLRHVRARCAQGLMLSAVFALTQVARAAAGTWADAVLDRSPPDPR